MEHKTIDRTVYSVIGEQINKESEKLQTTLNDFKTLVQDTYATKESTASAYNYCDSVETYDQLPGGAKKGDVYNVQSDGMNYAWDGTEWDELGMIIDLDSLALKAEVEKSLSTKVDNSEYSTKVKALENSVETKFQDLDTRKVDKDSYNLDKQTSSSDTQGKIDALQKSLSERMDTLESSKLDQETYNSDKETLDSQIEGLSSSKVDNTTYTEKVTEIEGNYTELEEKVNGIDSAYQAADSLIKGQLSDLTSKYTEADTQINLKISGLDEAYKAADAVLQEGIDNLDKNYKAADTVFDSRLKDLEGRIQSLETQLEGLNTFLEAVI